MSALERGRTAAAAQTTVSLRAISWVGAQHRGRRGARLARRDDREYREYL